MLIAIWLPKRGVGADKQGGKEHHLKNKHRGASRHNICKVVDAVTELSLRLDKELAMESMTYTLNDIQVVVLENEFDAMAVSELRPLFETLSTHPGDILADISDVHFIDSSGIGALVFLYKRLIMNGHQMALVCGPGQPHDLLEMLHIDRVIPCHESIKAYMRSRGMMAAAS
ncbi:STAS domain-containing protein [Aeromonas allosaccharophila]